LETMRTIQESIPPHNAETGHDRAVIVLTTWPADAGGDEVARALVERRLAACVTRLPLHRVVYRWKDAIEDGDESQWLIKTTADRLEGLWEAVRTAHPYDTPEWLVVPVEAGSADYLAWVRASTAPAAP